MEAELNKMRSKLNDLEQRLHDWDTAYEYCITVLQEVKGALDDLEYKYQGGE